MMLRMRLRRVGRMTGGRSEVEFIIAIWIDVSDETLVLKKNPKLLRRDNCQSSHFFTSSVHYERWQGLVSHSNVLDL